MKRDFHFRVSLFSIPVKSEIIKVKIPLRAITRHEIKRIGSKLVNNNHVCMFTRATFKVNLSYAPWCVVVILKITPLARCARLIERPGKLPVLSTRLIVRRVFSHQRVHTFFPPFTPISLFFFSLPLVYSRPRIRISLIPLPLFNICTRARIVSLSFNDIVDPSSRQPTCVRHWVKAKAKNLQGYFPLCFSPSSFRCSFSIDLNIDILFFLFVPFLRRGAKFLRVM